MDDSSARLDVPWYMWKSLRILSLYCFCVGRGSIELRPYRQSGIDSNSVVLPAPFLPPNSTTGLSLSTTRSNSFLPRYTPRSVSTSFCSSIT